ncbi:MAG: hypothetical protein IPG04_01520 [Polyangiaceae bacterium]|nr:hypothetical protein [Polyangiaceae bacterium]
MALPTASAQGKPPAKTPTTKKKEDKKPAATAEAPTVATPVTIAPKDLAWGIDKKKLATIYDKVIDEDYKPKYQKTQPGPALDRLDAEVAEKKAEFRRSEIQFGSVATGMDQTNLKGEFTYGNKEHLLSIDRGGKTRYFFFIGDKMWKVVDAIKLGEKSQWGKTFDDAVAILNKHYGVAGRARPPMTQRAGRSPRSTGRTPSSRCARSTGTTARSGWSSKTRSRSPTSRPCARPRPRPPRRSTPR